MFAGEVKGRRKDGHLCCFLCFVCCCCCWLTLEKKSSGNKKISRGMFLDIFVLASLIHLLSC